MFVKLIKKLVIISAFCCLLVGFLPVPVVAQMKFSNFLDNLTAAAPSSSFKTVNSLPNKDVNVYFNDLISRIIAVVIGLTGTLFLILIIYSGWQWLTASGEEEKITKAKDRIKNGVIGLGLCLLAFGVTSFLNNIIENKFFTEPPAAPAVRTPAESSLCRTNLDCEDQAPFLVCDQVNGVCVECLNDENCLGGLCINRRCSVSDVLDTCMNKSKADCQSANSPNCNWVKIGADFKDTNGICRATLNTPCNSKCEAQKVCYAGNCETECGKDASVCSPAVVNTYTCDPNEHICKVLGIW